MKILQYDNLLKLTASVNIHLCAVVNLSSIRTILIENKARLEHWQQAGYAAEMSYMNRSSGIFCDPENFLPGIKSILLCAIPYSLPKEQDPECPKGYGKVARYARGRDYHQVLREALQEYLSCLKNEYSGIGINGRVFTDAVPLLERALAAGSGLGFIGKSAMNIIPGIGTYFFIGEVLLDCEIEGVPEKPVVKASCGTCVNCMTSCPTNAFVAPKVLDARKCISYLTIEKRSVHTDEEAGLLGDWIFGCDVCQEVCPFNQHGKEVIPWEYFKAEHGAGAFLNIPELISIRDNSAFKKKFSHTPLMRAKREGLIRNGLCVLQNQKATEYYQEIIDCLQGDSSELIRSQAAQTLKKFLDLETGAVASKISAVLSSENLLA